MTDPLLPSTGLAEFYRDFLNEEGYRASIDEDGDVAFKFEGGNYFISIYEDDGEYFQLVYPYFWEIESDEERELAKAACIEITRGQKAAKVFMVKNNADVSATAEAFFDSREDVKKIFPRYIRSIQSAVAAFREAMRKGRGQLQEQEP
jgi:hypothetical protein